MAQSKEPFVSAKTTLYKDAETGKEVTREISYVSASRMHSASNADLYENLIKHGQFALSDYQVKNASVHTRDYFKNLNRQQIVSKSMKMYDEYGTVRSICDAVANFVSTSYQYVVDESKDKSGRISLFWEKYYRMLNMRRLICQQVLDILRAGNAFIVESDGQYNPKFDRFTPVNESSVLDRYTQSIIPLTSTAYKDWQEYLASLREREIPLRFDILNPSNVSVAGDGIGGWTYKISLTEESYKAIKAKIKAGKKNMQSVPAAFIEAITRSEGADIIFHPGEMIHLAYKKQPYEAYGLPFWWGAAATIEQKDNQMELDETALSNQMTRAWTVTVGDKDFPATKDQIEAIGDLFANGVKPGSIYFWNHTLDVKPLEQKFEPTSKDIYDSMNEQVFNEIGFPSLFAGGMEGSNFSIAAYQIMPLEQFVVDFQNMLKLDFLDDFHERVSAQMGFRTVPQGRFAKNALRDQDAFQKGLLQWWDRGVYLLDQLADSLGTTDSAIVDQNKRVMKIIEEGHIPDLNGSPYNSPKDGDGKPSGPPQNRPSDDPDPKKIPDRPKRVYKK